MERCSTILLISNATPRIQDSVALIRVELVSGWNILVVDSHRVVVFGPSDDNLGLSLIALHVIILRMHCWFHYFLHRSGHHISCLHSEWNLLGITLAKKWLILYLVIIWSSLAFSKLLKWRKLLWKLIFRVGWCSPLIFAHKIVGRGSLVVAQAFSALISRPRIQLQIHCYIKVRCLTNLKLLDRIPVLRIHIVRTRLSMRFFTKVWFTFFVFWFHLEE